MKQPAMGTMNDRLDALRKRMFDLYAAYRGGRISQKEYLFAVRPIDMKIDRIELSVLKKGLRSESSL